MLHALVVHGPHFRHYSLMTSDFSVNLQWNCSGLGFKLELEISLSSLNSSKKQNADIMADNVEECDRLLFFSWRSGGLVDFLLLP